MKTAIFYFSGTGNSLKVARDIGALVEETELISIPSVINANMDFKYDRIGIVFPVYAFGMPLIVTKFIKKIKLSSEQYVFAVATYGGMPGATLRQMEKILSEKNIKLSAGFLVQMPGNCITLYGAKSEEEQKKLFESESVKVKEIASSIKECRVNKIVGSFSRIGMLLGTFVYKKAMERYPSYGKNFKVYEKCNGCGTCERICQVHNIKMVDKKPQWLNQCEQCLACIQWCPQEAIQYGNKTASRKRYRHPEISSKDLIRK